MYKKKLKKYLRQSEEFRAKFIAIIDEDAAAFNNVMAAYGLPKQTEEQKTKRTTEIQETMKTATLIPLELMELCIEAMKLVRIVIEQGNQNSFSDAGVAALMLHAGCEGAALNININLGSLNDANFVDQTKTIVEQKRNSIDAIASDILEYVNKQFA